MIKPGRTSFPRGEIEGMITCSYILFNMFSNKKKKLPIVHLQDITSSSRLCRLIYISLLLSRSVTQCGPRNKNCRRFTCCKLRMSVHGLRRKDHMVIHSMNLNWTGFNLTPPLSVWVNGTYSASSSTQMKSVLPLLA